MRPRFFYRHAFIALLLASLSVFLLWPILLTVRGAFLSPKGELTLYYFTSIFRDPRLVQGMINSALIATLTTAAALLISLPLSLLAARRDFPAKALMAGLILVPLILPPFVGAIGVRAILGRFGALSALLTDLHLLPANLPGVDLLGVGFWGVVIMEALHLFPIIYLNLTAAIANIDPALEEAAVNLGATRLRLFRRVTLPLMLPGVFAGATIVWIASFTELGTPLIFGYRQVMPVQIFEALQDVQVNPRPYAQVLVMLLAAVLLYGFGRWSVGRHAYAMSSKAGPAGSTLPLPGAKGWLATALFAAIFLLAALPHVGVVLTSFSRDGAWYRSILPTEWTLDHYSSALSQPLVITAVRNSLILSLLAMMTCVVVGFAVAYVTVRLKPLGSSLLDSLAMLPLAVPGLVMAFGYVAMTLTWPFGPDGPLGNALSVLGTSPNPLPLLVIAYAVRRLPYVVRAAAAGLQQTSGTLEEAALNLGASTWTTLRRIVVPLLAANLIAGAILAFSFSMLEVSDSLILAQRQQHFPITKAIFEFYTRLGDGPAIATAMGVWGMAILTLTMLAASTLLGKRMGAVFRV